MHRPAKGRIALHLVAKSEQRKESGYFERLREVQRIPRMPHKILALIISIFLFVFAGEAVWAEELIKAQISKSPDGRKQLEMKFHSGDDFPRIEVVLTEGAKILFETRIPPEKEARYAKLSWSPSSEAVLVGVNYKAGEDWILIQLSKDKASSTYFDGDSLVTEKLLKKLPFRDDIKSSAPVGRVPWKTVRWLGPKQCEMAFIFHGIGYQGTAHLLIDFQRKNPAFTITSIVPTVDVELWKQN